MLIDLKTHLNRCSEYHCIARWGQVSYYLQQDRVEEGVSFLRDEQHEAGRGRLHVKVIVQADPVHQPGHPDL